MSQLTSLGCLVHEQNAAHDDTGNHKTGWYYTIAEISRGRQISSVYLALLLIYIRVCMLCYCQQRLGPEQRKRNLPQNKPTTLATGNRQ